MLTVSQRLYPFIIAFETLHDGDLSTIGLEPKLDPTGNWTEGYGRLMTKNGKAMTVKQYPTLKSILPYRTIETEKEARLALVVDVEAFATKVNKWLTVKVTQWEFDALVSHAYNCGYSGTMYTLVNGRAKEQAIKNWFTSKYITSRGVFLQGLQYRRNDEYEIWAGINYKREYKRSV